jgi:hypothetical protein
MGVSDQRLLAVVIGVGAELIRIVRSQTANNPKATEVLGF